MFHEERGVGGGEGGEEVINRKEKWSFIRIIVHSDKYY